MRNAGYALAAAIVLAAVSALPVNAELTKAPYLTNMDHALKLASQSGRDAVIYFFSET